MAEASNDLQKCRNLHVKREIKQLYFPFVFTQKRKKRKNTHAVLVVVVSSEGNCAV